MSNSSCFILMPFSKAEIKEASLQKEQLEYIYKNVLKKAVEEYRISGSETPYFKMVERFSGKIGSLISGIINRLYEDELVIADLSGLNANVMYELGVRHALKRGTIVVTQDVSSLPSDLRNHLVVEYAFVDQVTAAENHYERFKAELHKAIDEILSTTKHDSPVLEYFNAAERFRNEQEIKKLKEQFIVVDAISSEVDSIMGVIEEMDSNLGFGPEDKARLIQFIGFRVNNIMSMLNEINIPITSNNLYTNIVCFKTLFTEPLKDIALSAYFNQIGISITEQNPFKALAIDSINMFLEKDFLNPFWGFNSEPIMINFRQVFAENGLIERKLLDLLDEYLENRQKELALTDNEIDMTLPPIE